MWKGKERQSNVVEVDCSGKGEVLEGMEYGKEVEKVME